MARQPAEIVRNERLATRRREVRRQNMRRRRRVTFGAVSVLLLATGGFALARSALFRLDGIEVTGAKALTSAEVVQASGLRTGQSLFSLHTDRVRARIEDLPGVLRASVTRVRTSWVRIAIAERTPAFVLETFEGRWYLDDRATLMDEAPPTPQPLPTIRLDAWIEADPGDRVRAPALADAVRLWAALPSTLRAGPATIATSGVAGLTLIRPDYSIRFGGPERLDDKLRAVRLVLARVRRSGDRMLALDVRAPSRPAARLA